MGDPDVIWVEKELLPGLPGFLETRFWRPNANITVIDYDDAVFLNYSDKWAGQLGRAQKFEDYARGAARVVVGSANLKKQMDSWGSAQTTYVPSTVDVGAYPIHEHIDRRPIVIGWIGTPKTVHFLDCLREVFPAVARRFWIQLKIIGASWHCPGLEVRTFPWSKQTEAELVSSFDIGVMPLLDGAWERAKCGYKIIQYMAAGVVPVAARVGENKNIIQEGVNGYLASEPSEWVETLCRLCGDVQLRSEIAANSRKFAIAKYDVRVAVRATDAIFSAIGSPKRTPRL
jgi:glycosyltransferase involved in cell wall biosynthesis